MTEQLPPTPAGCGESCPCASVRAIGNVWPVFSTGDRFELVEVPGDARAVLHPGDRGRYFQWRRVA